MKPNESNIIIRKENKDGVEYASFYNAGSELSTQMLNWIVFEYIIKQKNVQYWIDGGVVRIGSNDFLQKVTGHPQGGL